LSKQKQSTQPSGFAPVRANDPSRQSQHFLPDTLAFEQEKEVNFNEKFVYGYRPATNAEVEVFWTFKYSKSTHLGKKKCSASDCLFTLSRRCFVFYMTLSRILMSENVCNNENKGIKTIQKETSFRLIHI
jgi:hypothetical protein